MIRVVLVGDHPWKDNFGWIKPNENGKYTTIRPLGLGDGMVKADLDNGHSCYAGKENIQHLKEEADGH